MADTQSPQSIDRDEALERLCRLSLRELSMDSLLQTVADLTKTVMPGSLGFGWSAGVPASPAHAIRR